MRVTFNELADRELNDAAQYYEVERADLGTAFIAEVQRCTQDVVDHPFPVLIRRPNHRLQPLALTRLALRAVARLPLGGLDAPGLAHRQHLPR